MIDFLSFLNDIGVDKTQTRIEKYRIDGTSNYLVSLNYSGITWAVALRVPAMGKDASLFEKEKQRAVKTAQYLVERFENGVRISDNVDFCFRGNSALVSNSSVQEFFKYQNGLAALTETEEITGENIRNIVSAQVYPDGIDNVKNVDAEKKEQVKRYMLEYRGTFFASKGAPASETLDDYFDMVFEIAKVLSVLHKNTGLKTLLPKEKVCRLTAQLDAELNKMADEIEFKQGTSVYESYLKHQKKRNEKGDERISRLIKKELLLRTSYGKKALEDIIAECEKSEADFKQYVCFTHNDPHCENFVIVKSLYRVIACNHRFMDREFLNKVISAADGKNADVKYSVEYLKESNTLNVRKYKRGDEQNSCVNVIAPDLHYDVHLIDIDDATGADEECKKSYLYDLPVFALSAQNLSAIKGGSIKAEDVVDEYYKYWSTIK